MYFTRYWNPGDITNISESRLLVDSMNVESMATNYILDERVTGIDGETYIGSGGCWLPGNHYMLIYRNADETENRISIFDTVNYTKTQSLEGLTLGHGNAAVWTPDGVFCPSDAQGIWTLCRFSWTNGILEFVERIVLTNRINSIAYDYATGKMYGLANSRVYSVDWRTGVASELFRFSLPDTLPPQTHYGASQNICVLGNKLIHTMAFPNALYFRNIETGVLEYIYNLPQIANSGFLIAELESLSWDFENGRFMFNSYGRYVDSQYSITGGNLGHNLVYSLGWNVIEDNPITYASGEGYNDTSGLGDGTTKGRGNTIGTGRVIHVVNNSEYYRHDGSGKYPFDNPSSAFAFLDYVQKNTARNYVSVVLDGHFTHQIHVPCDTDITINGVVNYLRVYRNCNVSISIPTVETVTGTQRIKQLVLGTNVCARINGNCDNLDFGANCRLYLNNLGNCTLSGDHSIIMTGATGMDNVKANVELCNFSSSGSEWLINSDTIPAYGFSFLNDYKHAKVTFLGTQSDNKGVAKKLIRIGYITDSYTTSAYGNVGVSAGIDISINGAWKIYNVNMSFTSSADGRTYPCNYAWQSNNGISFNFPINSTAGTLQGYVEFIEK